MSFKLNKSVIDYNVVASKAELGPTKYNNTIIPFDTGVSQVPNPTLHWFRTNPNDAYCEVASNYTQIKSGAGFEIYLTADSNIQFSFYPGSAAHFSLTYNGMTVDAHEDLITVNEPQWLKLTANDGSAYLKRLILNNTVVTVYDALYNAASNLSVGGLEISDTPILSEFELDNQLGYDHGDLEMQYVNWGSSGKYDRVTANTPYNVTPIIHTTDGGTTWQEYHTYFNNPIHDYSTTETNVPANYGYALRVKAPCTLTLTLTQIPDGTTVMVNDTVLSSLTYTWAVNLTSIVYIKVLGTGAARFKSLTIGHEAGVRSGIMVPLRARLFNGERRESNDLHVYSMKAREGRFEYLYAGGDGDDNLSIDGNSIDARYSSIGNLKLGPGRHGNQFSSCTYGNGTFKTITKTKTDNDAVTFVGVSPQIFGVNGINSSPRLLAGTNSWIDNNAISHSQLFSINLDNTTNKFITSKVVTDTTGTKLIYANNDTDFNASDGNYASISENNSSIFKIDSSGRPKFSNDGGRTWHYIAFLDDVTSNVTVTYETYDGDQSGGASGDTNTYTLIFERTSGARITTGAELKIAWESGYLTYKSGRWETTDGATYITTRRTIASVNSITMSSDVAIISVTVDGGTQRTIELDNWGSSGSTGASGRYTITDTQ